MLEDDLGLAGVAPAQVLHVPDDLPQDVLVRLAEVELPALGAGRCPLHAARKSRSHLFYELSI